MTDRAAIRLVGCFGSPLMVLLATGCAISGEDTAFGEENSGQSQEGVTTVVDFEDYAAGPLGAPWQLTPATSDSKIGIESTDDHGNVLLLQGSPATGQFLAAKLPFSGSTDIVASADINPDPDAGFVWSLHGQGVGTYERRIQLRRLTGSTTLVANAVPKNDTPATNDTVCGSLESGVWSNVSIVYRVGEDPHTFDVLINGEPTDCMGLESVTGTPFAGVQLMDGSDPDSGGNVRVDNITLAQP